MPYWFKKFVYDVWTIFIESGRVANKGERLVASSWSELLETGEFNHIMHAYRYWWANTKLPGFSTVLDFGCGTGYGSWYLENVGHFVVGYDLDDIAISWAKKHFEHDESELVFTDKLCDVDKINHIVCFEVIEHEPKIFPEIINLMNTDGSLIISTANAQPEHIRQWLIDNKLVTVNHTHVKEYTPKEFRDLLESVFNDVTLYGQVPSEVNCFKDYDDKRRVPGHNLESFEMIKDDFQYSEVIVGVCHNLK